VTPEQLVHKVHKEMRESQLQSSQLFHGTTLATIKLWEQAILKFISSLKVRSNYTFEYLAVAEFAPESSVAMKS
jgi:hypothetical protein